MPEGDTVWSAARRLGEALEGRQLTRTDFRVPRYATTDLTGRQVTESLSRGKHLLTRVEGGVTVHTHLKMDGAWRVRPARERPRRRAPDPAGAGQRHLAGHRLPARHRRGAAHRPGGRGGRAPRAGPARPGLGPGRGGPPAQGRARTGRSARRCWTSATWPASATCTSARCCSCAASSRGGRSAQIEDLAALAEPGAPAAGREQEPDRAHHHRARPSAAPSTGCTAGAAARAAAAAPRSKGPTRARTRRRGSPSGARAASPSCQP